MPIPKHLQPQGSNRWVWDDPRQAYVRLHLQGNVLSGRVAGIPNVVAEIGAWGQEQGWQVYLEAHPFADVQPGFAVVAETLVDAWVDPELGFHEANRATQVRWGTGIRVCEVREEWIWGHLLDDGYGAWIPKTGVIDQVREQIIRRQQAAQRIVPKSGWVGDRWLWAGTAIPLVGDFPAVEQAAQHFPDPLPCTPETVVAQARRFLPGGDEAVTAYLWGGTAGSRLDCSGFVQTVARLCGRVLPRDGDQQATICQLGTWERAAPGDLVFFGEDGQGITHVGIALGGGEVIHCSRFHNGVRIDNLRDPQTDYAQQLRRMVWSSGRWF